MARTLARLVLVSLLLAAAGLAALAAPPDLVVVVSIDQFPYDHIARFKPYFTGGLARLLGGGATYAAASYPYATTFTGPGHAAIGTGYPPADSGIIANTWVDRATGKPLYCTADARVATAVAGPVKPGPDGRPKVPKPMSPLNLTSDSLGDRLLEKHPHSKVIGVSLKDRAAILMAGRKATAAYWFDLDAGGFTSSSYYRFNPKLFEFNAGLDRVLAATEGFWRMSPELERIPAAAREQLTHDPPELRDFKKNVRGLGTSFPHPIPSLDALTFTPFGNDLVLEFAWKVIEEEQLGRRGTPDVLFVSLSSPDYLGHVFGPDSLEAADSALVVDRQLGTFLDRLDGAFKGKVTVALTSDHGVQSIPGIAKALGREAGIVDVRNPGKNDRTFRDLAPDRRALEIGVAKRLEIEVGDDTPIGDALIAVFEEPGFYLNWSRVGRLGRDPERVKTALRDELARLPAVRAAYTNTALLDPPRPDAPPVEQAVRLSFRSDRSGDVLAVLKDGYIWHPGEYNTTHGQPAPADQHVPLMLWGNGIRPGADDTTAVTPLQLARTLGLLLGVDAGSPASPALPCVTPEAARETAH